MLSISASGKVSIIKKEAFCFLIKHYPITKNTNLIDYFKEWDSYLKAQQPSITRGSLNNCHGDWYEWLIAITAWNCRQLNKVKEIALLVPNATRLDIHSLYNNQVQSIVKEIKERARKKEVNFISSNPDFAVVRAPSVEKKIFSFEKIQISDLDFLDNYYQNFLGKMAFEDLTGFLSVKTSFRPDRRLQIAHEGSSLKAMHHYIAKHLSPPRNMKLLYQAVSTNATRADLKALKTLAPYSISLGDNHLEPSIDHVEKIDCLSSAKSFFEKTFN